MVTETDVTYVNVNYKVANKLLWFVTSAEERRRWGVDQFCSQRSCPGGRPPSLSGFFNENEEYWIHFSGPMTGREERQVLGAVMAGLVGKVLGRHPVTCGGDTFVQNSGGAIGLDLTCTVAKSVMQKFDSKLESLLQGLAYNCHLNSTYVDDKLIVTQVPPPGLRYEGGGEARVVESQVEPDRLLPGDRRTANFIQSVADDIFGCLRFTADCPSNNDDNRMPVLDLKVWLEKCPDGTNRIRHVFYEKPCASALVVHKSSAISWPCKRATMISEVHRRLYNSDQWTTWSEKANTVNRLVVKMRRSGYNSRDIVTFVKGGVARYETRVADHRDGVRPMYRDQQYQAVERWRRKIAKSVNWSKAKTVMFLPFSKRLQSEAMPTVKSTRENIMIVEKGGTTIKSLLQRSDPSSRPECLDQICCVCSVRIGGQRDCRPGNCHLTGIGYVATCVTCQNNGIERVYEGESGRALKVRAQEHLRDIRANKDSSGLYRHVRDEHQGDPPEFRFQVRRQFTEPLLRQIEEGVRIENSNDDTLLNTRQEWVPPTLGRMQLN